MIVIYDKEFTVKEIELQRPMIVDFNESKVMFDSRYKFYVYSNEGLDLNLVYNNYNCYDTDTNEFYYITKMSTRTHNKKVEDEISIKKITPSIQEIAFIKLHY